MNVDDNCDDENSGGDDNDDDDGDDDESTVFGEEDHSFCTFPCVHNMSGCSYSNPTLDSQEPLQYATENPSVWREVLSPTPTDNAVVPMTTTFTRVDPFITQSRSELEDMIKAGEIAKAIIASNDYPELWDFAASHQPSFDQRFLAEPNFIQQCQLAPVWEQVSSALSDRYERNEASDRNWVSPSLYPFSHSIPFRGRDAQITPNSTPPGLPSPPYSPHSRQSCVSHPSYPYGSVQEQQLSQTECAAPTTPVSPCQSDVDDGSVDPTISWDFELHTKPPHTFGGVSSNNPFQCDTRTIDTDSSAITDTEYVVTKQKQTKGSRRKGKPTTEEDNPHLCVVCGKSFAKKFELNKHSGVHDPKHKCRYCPKRFPVRRDRDRHENDIHIKEIHYFCPFQTCDMSTKGTKRADNLKRHMKTIHSQE